MEGFNQRRQSGRLRLIDGGWQGCQTFLGTTYQNGKNAQKLPQNMPNVHKIFQMAVK
jgi:hypothetical protein